MFIQLLISNKKMFMRSNIIFLQKKKKKITAFDKILIIFYFI